MIENDRKYYVYQHINLDTNEIFYIGKGQGNRYLSEDRSKYWKNYIKKYPNWKSVILYDNLLEEESYDLESKEIERIGRRVTKNGTLVNILPGGKGFPENYIKYRDDLNAELGYEGEQESKEKLISLFFEKFNYLYLFDMSLSFYDIEEIKQISKISNLKLDKGKISYDWRTLDYNTKKYIIFIEHNNFIRAYITNQPKRFGSMKEYKDICQITDNYYNRINDTKNNIIISIIKMLTEWYEERNKK